MNGVFQKEIEEMYNKRLKEQEIEKIKKALLVGDFGEADVLFKYSLLTSKEYEAIKRELT